MPKLTNEHIYFDKIKKMLVKNATQIFSQKVAAVIMDYASEFFIFMILCIIILIRTYFSQYEIYNYRNQWTTTN